MLKFFLFMNLLICNIYANESDTQTEQTEISDPLEPVNRAVFSFNTLIDGLFLKPLAILYDQAMPSIVKTGVKNFTTNLKEIQNSIFYCLQGDVKNGLKSLGRFTFNTMTGCGGLIDFAKKIDLPYSETNMNETMVKWGIPMGIYIVIPFLGPSSMRGMSGTALDLISDPWYYIAANKKRAHNHHKQNLIPLYAIYAIDRVQKRAQLLEVIDSANRSLDPYAVIRSYYAQHQKNKEVEIRGEK